MRPYTLSIAACRPQRCKKVSPRLDEHLGKNAVGPIVLSFTLSICLFSIYSTIHLLEYVLIVCFFHYFIH